jgi:hypothetical protein
MFGLKKKLPEAEAGFKELLEVRDSLKKMTGEAMNIYIGTVVGHLLNLGNKSKADVESTKETVLKYLQKYIQAEIMLDRQKNIRHEPDLAELAGLVLR